MSSVVLTIRKATPDDADALMDLYHNHLTKFPPKEPQNIAVWREKLMRVEKDPMYHLLVAELAGKVVSSVRLS